MNPNDGFLCYKRPNQSMHDYIANHQKVRMRKCIPHRLDWTDDCRLEYFYISPYPSMLVLSGNIFTHYCLSTAWFISSVSFSDVLNGKMVKGLYLCSTF